MRKNSPLVSILKANPNLFVSLKEGDLAEGTVMQKENRSLYIDLGAVGTGIVYGAEFSNASDIIKGLSAGDKITAKVVETQNDDGYVELSLAQAGKQKAWQDLKDLQDKEEVVKVKIVGANAGGLLTDIHDVRGFLPVSQLATDHYPRVDDGDKGKILEELKKLVGQELETKIIDVNPRTNKLILSEREVLKENIKELLTKYSVGAIIDGIISGVADFGAFMKFADNPEIEGLIHISELDHKLIENPKDVVKVDDHVKAKIIEIKEGRVFLSLKALKPDPWQVISERYKEGQEVGGEVSRFNPFGAFINLDEQFQGLLHVSEFGSVEEMKKQLEVGKTYQFIIASIKPEEKRIILKIKK